REVAAARRPDGPPRMAVVAAAGGVPQLVDGVVLARLAACRPDAAEGGRVSPGGGGAAAHGHRRDGPSVVAVVADAPLPEFRVHFRYRRGAGGPRAADRLGLQLQPARRRPAAGA